MIGGFPILRCAACGFLQTGRVLSQDALARLYADGYGGLRQMQGQQINARVNTAALRRMGLLDRTLERVVDIGCGYGFLLQRLEGHALHRGGVELAAAEVQHARDALGLEVATSLDELPRNLRRDLDMILLFEVLEHIAEPVEFLRGLASRLRPGGILVIGTDNFTSWPVRIMGDHFPKWIPHQHVSLFDPASLRGIVDGLDGLETIATASYTPWELVARALVYKATSGRIGARDFALDAEMATENSRPFRGFAMRRLLNRFWIETTLRRDLGGEMMLIAARRLP